MFKNLIKNNIIFQKDKFYLKEFMTTTTKTADVGMHVNSPSLHVSERPLEKNKWIGNYTTFRYHLDIIFKEEKLYVYIYLKQCQIVSHWLDSWIPKNFKIKSPSLLFGSQNLPDNSNFGSFFQKKIQ